MGQHGSNSLDYFKVDCVQQDNLNYVESRFGIVGYGVYIKLLRKIYMIDGYFCQWSEKNVFMFAKEVGVPAEQVSDIVKLCLDEEMFSWDMYKKYQILTSAGIQKRWKRVVTDARRLHREISIEFDLLSKKSAEQSKTHEVLTEKVEQTIHNTLQYNTVHNNTEKEVVAPAAPTDQSDTGKKREAKKFIKPALAEVVDYFLQKIGNPKNRPYWPEDKCRNESAKLFDYYTTNGWKQGRGKPIVDWKAACRNWIRNAIENSFGKTTSFPPVPQTAPAAPPLVPVPPQLNKEQIQFNYLYDMFIDNKLTVISLDAVHYHYLKNTYKVEWTAMQIEKVEKLAIEHLNEKNIAVTDVERIRMMKKFAVLEYFELLRINGRTSVFELEKENIEA